MKRKAVRQILAAMMMIILLLPGSVSAEAAGSDPSRAGELHVPLVEMDTNGKMKGVRSDGIIPYGNGQISFDVIQVSNQQNGSKSVTASISYYASNGMTSQEILGWDLILNGHDGSPLHCDLWYTFPDGKQANYTNPQPVLFSEEIRSCRLIPVLADGLSSRTFPEVAAGFSEINSQPESQSVSTGFVSRGSVRIAFQYPTECEIVDEGSIGTSVYLNETDYVTLMIPKKKRSGTAAVFENIGDGEFVTELSENMNVFAVHGDTNHRMPGLDVVEAGINLPDGTGMVACTYCRYGHTEVYDLLLKILDSITDTTALKGWLENVWLPLIMQKT